MAARRPRVAVSAAEQQEAVDRFLAAITSGDVQGLLDVLAPDVALVADGGGVVSAIRRPVAGAPRVAALLTTGFPKASFDASVVWLNGSPAIRLDVDGVIDTAVSLVVEGGRITHIYAIRNPQKLARVQEPAPLARR